MNKKTSARVKKAIALLNAKHTKKNLDRYKRLFNKLNEKERFIVMRGVMAKRVVRCRDYDDLGELVLGYAKCLTRENEDADRLRYLG
jgi:hypothetical protein